MTAAELHLSEHINVRQEEIEAYGLTVFLSDTGGALGLFLGLSVLQIFQWLGQCYHMMRNVLTKFFNRKWSSIMVVHVFSTSII